ncbi:HNH endonuclease signature motif containing protein [Cellulosilyticum sp. ST5]|uniref:HNH endonuclease signature motif containing protein n=1 Tax=Cellulosilyticum sp. ST5 TaxID=3055805 RepID=UPI0039777B58
MSKKVCLFDPFTAERKLTDLNIVAGITGRTVNSVRGSIGCKLKILNCYLLELDTPLSVFRELLAKQIIPDEVWRDIPNSLWQVSSYGRYRSWLRCQDRCVYRLPFYGTKSTSQTMAIKVDGKRQDFRAQEWVYKLFIGEVPKGHVIYHKDGNKANNRVENLGAIKRNRLMQIQCTPVRTVEVQQIDLDTGEILAEYNSLKKAATVNYTDAKTLRDAIKKERPAIGFMWKMDQEKSII